MKVAGGLQKGLHPEHPRGGSQDSQGNEEQEPKANGCGRGRGRALRSPTATSSSASSFLASSPHQLPRPLPFLPPSQRLLLLYAPCWLTPPGGSCEEEGGRQGGPTVAAVSHA